MTLISVSNARIFQRVRDGASLGSGFRVGDGTGADYILRGPL